MFFNHFRLPVLSCLMIINIISAVAHGIEIKFTFELESDPDSKKIHLYEADEEVFQRPKTLANLIEDLGGFESIKNLDTPIPLRQKLTKNIKH